MRNATGDIFRTEWRALAREHREIERAIATVDSTAAMTFTLRPRELAGAVEHLVRTLEPTIVRHMTWEEVRWFPTVERLAQTTWVTQHLRWQHAYFRRAVQDLDARHRALGPSPTHRQLTALGGTLYGLHALLQSHMAQEEAVLSTLGASPLPAPDGDPAAGAGRAAGTSRDGAPSPAGTASSPVRAALTPRQAEVVRLLADGLTGAEVAALLGISEGTVKARVRDVRARLGVRDRTEIVAIAVERGLL